MRDVRRRIRQIVNLNLPAYGSVFVILSNRDDMQIISCPMQKLPVFLKPPVFLQNIVRRIKQWKRV